MYYFIKSILEVAMKFFPLPFHTFFRWDKQIAIPFLLIFLIFYFFNEFSQAQVNWTRYGNNPVLDVGPPGAFDDNNLTGGSVYFDGSTYHMWYSGGD